MARTHKRGKRGTSAFGAKRKWARGNFGFVGRKWELAEVGGRARNRRCANLSKPRPDLRVGESGIDLLVELFDNFRGCVLGRTDATPDDRLIARQEVA